MWRWNRKKESDGVVYWNFWLPALDTYEFSKPFLTVGLLFVLLGMGDVGDWSLLLFIGLTLIVIGRIEYRGDSDGNT